MNVPRRVIPLALAVLTSCASQPDQTQSERLDADITAGMSELLPGVRIDREAQRVAFEGRVPIDAHDPDTPLVFLELVACTPDTREHESLVVAPVRPSHVHAALLAVGFEPGHPGGFRPTEDAIVPITPEGDPVRVLLLPKGGRPAAPADWVTHAETGQRWTPEGYVFAGSRMMERGGQYRYDADGTGTLIGLTTFGSEVIAPRDVRSPDTATAAPIWIADRDAIPEQGTPVTVVLEAKDSAGRSGRAP